jgi:hypothetical protein
MKTKLVMLFGLIAVVITVYAKIITLPYDKSKPPGMSLPAAYERAMAALNFDTNQFHCVSAAVTDEFIGGGEWYFTFCSTNSKATPKWIAVGFNGKVIFDDGDR